MRLLYCSSKSDRTGIQADSSGFYIRKQPTTGLTLTLGKMSRAPSTARLPAGPFKLLFCTTTRCTVFTVLTFQCRFSQRTRKMSETNTVQ